MVGPLGAVVTLISSGRKGMAELLSLSMRAPSRSSTALLQGVYALPPQSAARARRSGGFAAIALTVASGFAVVALILVLGS
jgi:hypothetical protein